MNTESYFNLNVASLPFWHKAVPAEWAWTDQRAIFIHPTNKCTRLISPPYPFTEFIVHVAVQKDFPSMFLF